MSTRQVIFRGGESLLFEVYVQALTYALALALALKQVYKPCYPKQVYIHCYPKVFKSCCTREVYYPCSPKQVYNRHDQY